MRRNNAPSRAEILNYWFLIELFSPQPLPSLRRNRGTVTAPRPDSDLLWRTPEPRAQDNKNKRTYLHRVYVGLFSQSDLSESVIQRIGNPALSDAERIALDNRNDAEYCLFSFDVNDSGSPIAESLFLSSAAWAAFGRQANRTEPKECLTGFRAAEQEADQLFKKWRKSLSPHEDTDPPRGEPDRQAAHTKNDSRETVTQADMDDTDGNRPEVGLGISDIQAFAEQMADLIGWKSTLDKKQSSQLRIQKIPRSKKGTDTRPDDPLNSFYLNDLEHIRQNMMQGHTGQPLKTYLASEAPPSRIDVDNDLDAVWKMLAPERFPSGCWPAPGHYPLAHSQQLAVNQAINGFAQGGILAVNGPPGTGKTTLLQDIVAAIVSRRAEALLELDNPEALFARKSSLKYLKTTYWVHTFSTPFQSTGIVVASSNNGAVENISLELPQHTAIDPSWQSNTNYFCDMATDLLNSSNPQGKTQTVPTKQSWALITARLGNSSNRNQFVNTFWFQETGNFREYLEEKERTNSQNPQGATWEKARSDFQAALNEQKQWQDQAQAIFHTLEKSTTLRKNLQALTDNEANCKEALVSAHNRMNQARTNEQEAEIALIERQQAIEAHQDEYPGWLRSLLTLGKAWWLWRKRARTLQAKLRGAKLDHRKARLIAERETRNTAEAQRQHRAAQAACQRCREAIAACQAEIRAARTNGWQIPDRTTWATDETARETAAPWHHPEWRAARTRVFLRALDLHRAAIECQPKKFKNNLSLMMDILAGRIPANNETRQAAHAAWDTLFFVIPVVSTTFASFARQFRHLEHDRIGWLLIDEAGQSLPQAAAGALWRSRRAVVVGDPFQLEPIGNLPFSLQSRLASHFDIGEEWIPERISAQGIADRASPVGAWRACLDEPPVWVGCPLRVHRRCDEPMFRIANQIAYGNKMVNDVTRSQDLDLPPSGWCHIDAHTAEVDGHWIRQETDAAACLAEWLVHTARIAPDDIFVISPFRDTVSAFARYPILKRTRSGTIHTMQGKQADVVILALGGNPRTPGVRAWASERPNLLNVAVTRARRRLYVIGDRNLWRKCRYFNVCDRFLDILMGEDFDCNATPPSLQEWPFP